MSILTADTNDDEIDELISTDLEGSGDIEETDILESEDYGEYEEPEEESERLISSQRTKYLAILAIAIMVGVSLVIFANMFLIGADRREVPPLEEALPPGYDTEEVNWINSCQELQDISNSLASAYALDGNIDCSETLEWNNGKGFDPLGKTPWHEEDPIPFNGVLLGRGYTITNLHINRPNEDYVGLFGYLDEDGVVKNLGLQNIDITGNDDLGGLAGFNSGSISNSFVKGNIQGNQGVGGFVGMNDGSITTSFSSGSVDGQEKYIGGLIGWNFEEASNSYSTATVSGGEEVGGLVGYLDGSVDRSYSTGSVEGDWYVGGLIGTSDGSVSNSFWDTDTSNRVSSQGGSGLSTAEMKDKSFFTDAGWNFGEIWHMPEDSYPEFQWYQ